MSKLKEKNGMADTSTTEELDYVEKFRLSVHSEIIDRNTKLKIYKPPEITAYQAIEVIKKLGNSLEEIVEAADDPEKAEKPVVMPVGVSPVISLELWVEGTFGPFMAVPAGNIRSKIGALDDLERWLNTMLDIVHLMQAETCRKAILPNESMEVT